MFLWPYLRFKCLPKLIYIPQKEHHLQNIYNHRNEFLH